MKLLYIWNTMVKKLRGSAVINSEIHKTSKVESGSKVINSKMDRYSFCGYDCKIINCEIGSFCSIADGVIIGGARHPMEWASTSPVFYLGRDSVRKKFSEFPRPEDESTYIGNDVWIGDRATIKAGVSIEDGAVIGMGSVVTKNIGPYEIWAGNPAKFIRKRFPEELISQLMEKKWWEKPDDEIGKAANLIRNPEEFIRTI